MAIQICFPFLNKKKNKLAVEMYFGEILIKFSSFTHFKQNDVQYNTYPMLTIIVRAAQTACLQIHIVPWLC